MWRIWLKNPQELRIVEISSSYTIIIIHIVISCINRTYRSCKTTKKQAVSYRNIYQSLLQNKETLTHKKETHARDWKLALLSQHRQTEIQKAADQRRWNRDTLRERERESGNYLHVCDPLVGLIWRALRDPQALATWVPAWAPTSCPQKAPSRRLWEYRRKTSESRPRLNP